MNLFIAFFVTVIIEGLLIELIYPFFHFGCSRQNILYISFLCNLLTNPALNLIVLIFRMRLLPILLLEIAVIIIESCIYKRLTDISIKGCIVLSFILNGCSYLAGYFS